MEGELKLPIKFLPHCSPVLFGPQLLSGVSGGGGGDNSDIFLALESSCSRPIIVLSVGVVVFAGSLRSEADCRTSASSSKIVRTILVFFTLVNGCRNLCADLERGGCCCCSRSNGSGVFVDNLVPNTRRLEGVRYIYCEQ